METLILAFGHKAQNGKGECCEAIYRKFSQEHGGPYDIALFSFADALREEVEAAAFDIFVQHYPNRSFDSFDAMDLLCQWAGVPFDPNAKVEPKYPYTKQRKLYQWWGTEYRRAQDPNYWVKKVRDKVKARKPQIALFDDLRFPNEFFFVKDENGFTTKVNRVGFISNVPQHESEIALDGYEFDNTIDCPDGHLELLKQMAVSLFESIVTALTPDEDLLADMIPTGTTYYTIKDAERDILENALRNN